MEKYYIDYGLENDLWIMDVTAQDRDGNEVYLFVQVDPYSSQYEDDLGMIAYVDMKRAIIQQAKEKNVDSDCLVFPF